MGTLDHRLMDNFLSEIYKEQHVSIQGDTAVACFLGQPIIQRFRKPHTSLYFVLFVFHVHHPFKSALKRSKR